VCDAIHMVGLILTLTLLAQNSTPLKQTLMLLLMICHAMHIMMYVWNRNYLFTQPPGGSLFLCCI